MNEFFKTEEGFAYLEKLPERLKKRRELLKQYCLNKYHTEKLLKELDSLNKGKTEIMEKIEQQDAEITELFNIK